MTKQEQIEEMCEVIASMICQIYNPQCNEYEPHTCSHCYANDTLIGDFAEMLYNAGYRKIMNGKELNSEPDEEECDVIDDYTIGFATYLMQKRRDEVDRLQSEIKRLKKENAYLLKACEEKFTFNTTGFLTEN